MIHLVKTRNNGPRCIEYRVYLLTSISRFSTTRFKLGKCTTFENWSIIALVDFKTCPIIDKLLLLGRLLIRLTSSSTFFMKSSISSLPDLDMPDRAIFILAARMPFLSVRSNLLSSKLSSAWMHALPNNDWYYSPFSSKSTTLPSCFPTRTLRTSPYRYPRWSVIFTVDDGSNQLICKEVNIALRVNHHHNTTHIRLFAFHSHLTTDDRGLDFVDSATLLSATYSDTE